MTIAIELERELVDAVRRHRDARALSEAPSGPEGSSRGEAASRRWAGRARHRRTTLLFAIVAMLSLSGVAIAASGLLSGAPVRLEGGVPLSARSGYGLPERGGAQLLPISMPDPGGGPPWGARYVVTSRGVGCLQFGRVVRGQLGVIGRDGAFGNDGRFHPLPSDYLEGPFPCATIDRAGNAFAAVVIDGMPASGMLGGAANGGCLAPGQPTSLLRRRKLSRCPFRDERYVLAGLAGPRAERVFYDDAGTLKSVPTAGSDGAYLVVMQMSPGMRDDGNYSPVIAGVGAGAIVKVAYRGGEVVDCAPQAAGERICPAVGEGSPPQTPRRSAAATRSPLSIRVRAGQAERTLVVSFRARVAVHNAASEYWVAVKTPGHGPRCGDETLGPVFRDVRAGSLVRYRTRVSDTCDGRFQITVTYRQSTAGSSLPALRIGRGRTRTLLVGRRSIRLGASRAP